MRVGLNATCLNARPSGAKQRFIGLYSELARRLPDTEFVIFEPCDYRVAEAFEGLPNVTARQTPVPSEGRWQRLAGGLGYWNRAFAQESFDIFEALHLPLIRPKQGKVILTIHDIRSVQTDGGTLGRAISGVALRHALKRADHVVTVSQAMRQEILAFYPHTPVSVVYNGLNFDDNDRITDEECALFCAKYKLPEGFILSVGHYEKRKNYARLIEAVRILKRRGTACSLVIVGNDNGEGGQLKRHIDDLGMSGDVFFINGLSDRELKCAYKLAALFAFPSSYEGFGIPILEAMAAGCPMVLSDIPVFREITENRALYFDHDSAESMADVIEQGLTARKTRDEMVYYGFQRVRDFEYKHIVESMIDVYRAVGVYAPGIKGAGG